MSFKESEQKAGLQELVSWLKNQRVISNYNAKIFSNDPEKFIEELNLVQTNVFFEQMCKTMQTTVQQV